MKKKLLGLIAILLIQLPIFALAENDGDVFIGRFELEKVLNLGSGLLALALFIITLYAYKRNRNKRLLYVSYAFLLFAVKGILVSMEMFFGDWPWVDPVSSVLDFAILLSFFFGIIKK
nr:hypothetical protein [Candidatus Woesearchaeota archaeon]